MAVRIEAGHDGASLAIKTTNGADENGLRRLHAERSVLETLWVPGLVELVPGGPDEVRTRYVGDRTLANAQISDPAVVAAVMAAVAATVAVLHGRGLSHGRLTADHVLLDERGQAVLCSLSSPGLSLPLSTIVGPDAAPFAPDADTQALGAMLEDLVLKLPQPEGRRRAHAAAAKRAKLRAIAAAAGHRVGLLHAVEFGAALAAFSDHAGLPVRPPGTVSMATPAGGPPAAPPPPLLPTMPAPPVLPVPPTLLDSGPPTLPSAPPPPPLPLPPLPEPTTQAAPAPAAISALVSPPPMPSSLSVPAEVRIPILIGSVESDSPNGSNAPVDEPATRDFGPRRTIRSSEVESGRRLPLRLAIAAGVALVVGASTTTGVLLLSPGGNQAAAGPAPTTTTQPAPTSAPTLQSAPAPTTLAAPVIPAPPPNETPTTAPPPCPTSYADATAGGIPSHCAVTVTGNRVQLGELRWVVGDSGDRVVVGDGGCDGRLDVIVAKPATGEVFVFAGWAAPGDAVQARPVTVVDGVTGLRWDGEPCGSLAIVTASATTSIPARNLGGTR